MWKFSVFVTACVVCAAGAFAAPDDEPAMTEEETSAAEDGKPAKPAAKSGKEKAGKNAREKRPVGSLQAGFMAADKNEDGKLSLEEARAQWPKLDEKRFQALDKNDDGFVSREEAPRPPAKRKGDGAKAPGKGPDMEEQGAAKAAPSNAKRQGAGGEYWQRLTAADKDSDGTVSRDEWKAAFGETRTNRFETLRGNNEAGVNLETLRARMEARRGGAQGKNKIDPEAQRAYLGRLIKTLDKDDNAKVTWEEFQAGRPGVTRQAFDRMDADDDGALSEADLPKAP